MDSSERMITAKSLNGRLVVHVHLNLPPWPQLTHPAAVTLPDPEPPLPADPDLPSPPEDALPPPPAPVDVRRDDPKENPKTGTKSRSESFLNRFYLGFSDDAKRFYKTYRFWVFAILGCAPELYNAAVTNHMVTGSHMPSFLSKFFNIISFLGVATSLVKAKKREQQEAAE